MTQLGQVLDPRRSRRPTAARPQMQSCPGRASPATGGGLQTGGDRLTLASAGAAPHPLAACRFLTSPAMT
jgi:hypothetical protein